MYNTNCQTCSTKFEATRSDAKNCSNVCRSSSRRENDRRERARVTGALRRLIDAIGEIDEVIAQHASPREASLISSLVADARRATRHLP